MLQSFKRFIIFHALLAIPLTIDQWFFGVMSQIISKPHLIVGCQGQTILHKLLLCMGIGQRLLGFFIESIGTTLFIGTLYALYGIIKNLQTNQAFTQDTLDKMTSLNTKW